MLSEIPSTDCRRFKVSGAKCSVLASDRTVQKVEKGPLRGAKKGIPEGILEAPTIPNFNIIVNGECITSQVGIFFKNS